MSELTLWTWIGLIGITIAGAVFYVVIIGILVGAAISLWRSVRDEWGDL
jgi:hypothetical protein